MNLRSIWPTITNPNRRVIMDGIQQQRVMRAERYQLEDLTRDPELQPREAIDRDLA